MNFFLGKNKYLPYFFITLATIFWGLSFIATKFLLLNNITPFKIVFIRLFLCTIFFSLIFTFTKKFERLKTTHLKYFILISFFEPYTYFVGETYGLKYLNATTVSLLIATTPIFLAVSDFLFYKEKLLLINILGIILSFFGAILIILSYEQNLNFTINGLFFVFIAIFSAVAYTIILKKVTLFYNSLSIVFYQNLLGLPLFFLSTLILEGIQKQDLIILTTNKNIIIALLFLSIFPSLFAYVFYTYSIKKIGITRTGVFLNFIPVATLIFSYFLLQEEINTVKVLGIFSVIIGIYFSQKKFYEEKSL